MYCKMIFYYNDRGCIIEDVICGYFDEISELYNNICEICNSYTGEGYFYCDGVYIFNDYDEYNEIERYSLYDIIKYRAELRYRRLDFSTIEKFCAIDYGTIIDTKIKACNVNNLFT